MTIMRPGAEIVDEDLEQAGFRRFGDNAVLEWAFKEVGEDGEDAKGHFTLVQIKQALGQIHNDLFVREIELDTD
jgi:hypothetical protein